MWFFEEMKHFYRDTYIVIEATLDKQSQSTHILELSRELLADIELGRLEADKLLLKSSRLARLAASEEIQKWIGFEMQGYNATDPVAQKYLDLTGRWINREKLYAYWGPLAQQEASIEAQKAKLSALRLPDIGGDWANVATKNVLDTITTTANAMSTMAGVKSRVLALLHNFVVEIYYQREFAALAESTFDSYKKKVDSLIFAHAGDILKKIPAVVDRLSESDEESISQALSTCRRILEAFADSVFPPTDTTIELGGNVLKLDASKHQNRINAYIAARTESASRRQRLRQNLSNLFDRVSTGVHKDVTADEALSLFLNTYLFLGEVLHLGNPLTMEVASK